MPDTSSRHDDDHRPGDDPPKGPERRVERDRRDRYPYIHPEALRPAEHLAMDAEDILTFINHEDDDSPGPAIISDSQVP